jgi:hypothetical protein
MNDSRKIFDDLSKEFSIDYKIQVLIDLDIITDDILKFKLDQYIHILAHFTELYNEFDIKLIDNIEFISFKAYRNRALTYMMICQNQFITPITNELTLRSNKRLQTQASESIELGRRLLINAEKSSSYAKKTFYIAVFLSVVLTVISSVFGYFSDIDNNKIMNINSDSINSVAVKLNRIMDISNSYFEIQNEQNKTIFLKLDSVLIKKNVNKIPFKP